MVLFEVCGFSGAPEVLEWGFQKMSDNDPPVLAKSHPIFSEAWRCTWRVTKARLICPAAIAKVSIPVAVRLRYIQSSISWRAAEVAVIVCVGAMIATWIFNLCRIPFSMLAKHDNQLSELLARARSQPVLLEVKPAKPNIQYSQRAFTF
jgi:hypothetical protein